MDESGLLPLKKGECEGLMCDGKRDFWLKSKTHFFPTLNKKVPTLYKVSLI